VQSGALSAEQIVVKPHFVDPDPGVGEGAGDYAVFVGRLSYEKGLDTLLAAWEVLGQRIPLKIIGDGPLSPLVTEAAARQPNIQWLGRRTLAEVYDLIGDAAFHVFPSRCYETFGRVVTESFAKGTPVIASRHGSMADLIDHARTGMLFEPGNAAALAEAVRAMIPAASAMRPAARAEYEAAFTGERNHQQLMDIYARALHRRQSATSEPAATPTGVSKVAKV